MKKIAYLSVFLLIHSISAMDPIPDQSGIRQDCASRLCAFCEQMPQPSADILAAIDRLYDDPDIAAVGTAQELIRSLDAALSTVPDPETMPYAPGLDVAALGKNVMMQFHEVCQREGLDFNVHALNEFGKNNWAAIRKFLDDNSPPPELERLFGPDLSNLSVMRTKLAEIIEKMSPEIRVKNDLTVEYLDRALNVMQQGRHATLIPDAAKILCCYAPMLQVG